ncbi:hypothetical protein GOP47_0011288 [Adiantum capillus-veneris]|uniref:Chloride channel protein n=1 Tax=Adiantum capillus-veneris TaxID=13818 RepID=A0A9D4USH7_ADICA|nr:hypothetical protein GOP47_0011288 [Adiantum capillus-veneris]
MDHNDTTIGDMDQYDVHSYDDSMVDEQGQSTANADLENGCAEPLLPERTESMVLKRMGSSFPNATSQTAIIGVKSSHIESLDYEIVENDVFKQDWRSRTKVQILQYIILKWTMACLVGLCTGMVGYCINMAVEYIAGYKLSQTTSFLNKSRYLIAFSILAGSNMLLVFSAAVLCAIVGPAAAGSGIPEVKAYLNGIDAPNILSPRTLLVKVFGSIGAVAGGLSVGKEGPLVHIGSCIASLLSQGGSSRYRLTWRWLRYFKNDRDRRDLVTCGAAAGVAAAFRAPVGGVLFALEEAASWWRSSLLWRAFFTSATVAIALRVAVSNCDSSSCGVFGTGGSIMFDMGVVSTTTGLSELIPVVILGVVGGCLGSFFTFLSGKILRTYASWHARHGLFAKLLQAVLVAFITSLLMFGLPWLGTCTACPTESDECPSTGLSGKYKQFTCQSGHYNDLASLLLNTNDNVIRNLFSTNTAGLYRYSSLTILLCSSFFLALITYGTAIPSGLFIPVIIIGAAYGRLVGKFMTSFGQLETLDEGVYAYLGAASLLGGSMRMTVSVCVILLELTNNLLMLPPTMLVLLISKTIGDLFNHSVYDQILHIKGLPFLVEKPEPYMKHLTVMDVCSSPPVTLSATERVGNIVEVLKLTDHNGFPVIDHSSEVPKLHGLILRSHLLVLLKKGDFSEAQFCSVDFAKPGSGKGIKIEDIELQPEQLNKFVDLHPYTNASPYTVVESMSLAKAFSMFRQLALRHLCVVPTTPEVAPILGILTRHDFMPEHVLGLYPHLKANKWNRLQIQSSL